MVASASYIGIPVSTTQYVVGTIAGIGLVEGRRRVQWMSFGKCVIGWILVFFATAVLAATLFAVCAYSQSLTTVLILLML